MKESIFTINRHVIPFSRRMQIYAIPFAVLMLITACTGGKKEISTDKVPPSPPLPQEHRIPGEYLVKLTRPDTYFIKNYFSTYSIEFIKPIGGRPNTYHIKIHPDPGPEVLKRDAKKEMRIQSIEPNVIFKLDDR